MHDSNATAARRTTGKPLVRSFLQLIEAPPEAVFPLICPVQAGAWLEGCSECCDVLWSASGLAELGCVFRTREPGRPETIWIVTEHDPDHGAITFARVTAGLAASTVHVEVGPDGDGSSEVAIRYTVVPTSPEGAAYAEATYARAELGDSIAWWARSMNHFLRTGRKSSRDERDVVSRARANDPEDMDKE